jgi:hypothetical protein
VRRAGPARRAGRPGPGAARALVAALPLLLAACAAPAAAGAGAPDLLYVASAVEGGVLRVDARTGRPVAPPLPAPAGVLQLAVGHSGAVLARSFAAGRPSDLTHLAGTGAAPAARPVPLGPGATTVHLAGDGDRTAVVAYLPGGGPGVPPAPCALAVVDLDGGAVVHRRTACRPGEQAVALAVGDGGAGPVAYLGLWREGEPPGRPGAGRVAAFDAARGVALAAAPVAGAPSGLGVAPARDRPGARVYAAVAALEPDPLGASDPATRFAQAGGWRLLALDAVTLAFEREVALPGPALGLAVAPDGRDAYAFATDYRPAGRRLQRVDLATGAVTPAGTAPGFGLFGLAVTGDRLYVADPDGDRLWVADRAGRPRGFLPAGRRPTGVAARGAGSPGRSPRCSRSCSRSRRRPKRAPASRPRRSSSESIGRPPPRRGTAGRSRSPCSSSTGPTSPRPHWRRPGGAARPGGGLLRPGRLRRPGAGRRPRAERLGARPAHAAGLRRPGAGRPDLRRVRRARLRPLRGHRGRRAVRPRRAGGGPAALGRLGEGRADRRPGPPAPPRAGVPPGAHRAPPRPPGRRPAAPHRGVPPHGPRPGRPRLRHGAGGRGRPAGQRSHHRAARPQRAARRRADRPWAGGPRREHGADPRRLRRGGRGHPVRRPGRPALPRAPRRGRAAVRRRPRGRVGDTVSPVKCRPVAWRRELAPASMAGRRHR